MIWWSITAFRPRTSRHEPHQRSSLAFQRCHGVCTILRLSVSVSNFAVDVSLLLASLQGLGSDEIDVRAKKPLVSTRSRKGENGEGRGAYLYCACTLRLIRSISLKVSSFPCCTSNASHLDQNAGVVLGSQNCDAWPYIALARSISPNRRSISANLRHISRASLSGSAAMARS